MTVRDWQWHGQLSTCLVSRWLWNTYEVGVSTYGLTVRRWPQAETPRVTGLEPDTPSKLGPSADAENRIIPGISYLAPIFGKTVNDGQNGLAWVNNQHPAT